MKKSDLKKIIKQLVRECIHAVLLEEGLLSNIVSEVAQGMQGKTLVENKQSRPRQQAPPVSRNTGPSAIDARAKMATQRKQLMDSIGGDAYNGVNLFEGTDPMPSQTSASPGSIDLGAGNDPGVDISSFAGAGSKMWNLINKDNR